MTQAVYEKSLSSVGAGPRYQAAELRSVGLPARELRVAEPRVRARRPRVTSEELAILTLMANGLTLDSVAVRISVSPRTLSRRLRSVCNRLGVAHPIQAIVWAAREGLI